MAGEEGEYSEPTEGFLDNGKARPSQNPDSELKKSDYKESEDGEEEDDEHSLDKVKLATKLVRYLYKDNDEGNPLAAPSTTCACTHMALSITLSSD